MRTKVTLEPDLAKQVRSLAHRRGVSFKQALNEVLRRGLTAPSPREGGTFCDRASCGRVSPRCQSGQAESARRSTRGRGAHRESPAMILPDLNLIVSAYNRDAPHHAKARTWWETLLNDTEPVTIPWAVALGFVRLMAHRAVLHAPMAPASAIACVRAWFAQPSVDRLDPGSRTRGPARPLAGRRGDRRQPDDDAHLAALAIEHQCELHSNDNDFARFPGLRWRNPVTRSPRLLLPWLPGAHAVYRS